MIPNRGREGYLMIDHRASPGLPADIARNMGLDPKLAGEGKLLEAATMTCSHCKTVIAKNPLRMRERASCARCGWHYICDFCAAAMLRPDYSHLPFEGLIEIEQKFAQKGVQKFLGSPQELLQLSVTGRTPELNPLREKPAVIIP